MYIPPAFVETDLIHLHQFIEQHSFGLLITRQGDVPFASHLPFLLDRSQGANGMLIGHVARGNPQWSQAEGQTALAIFSGPQAYISPAWYEAENVVPTWNYVAVHVTGRPRFTHDPEVLQQIVADSVRFHERTLPQPWALGERNSFQEKLLGQIVGFQIEIETIEGKWKLSQNHPVERRKKVIRALRRSEAGDDQEIARLMEATLPREESLEQ